MEENMDKNNNFSKHKVCETCGCNGCHCGWGFGHHHYWLRALFIAVAMVLVFCLGIALGRLTGHRTYSHFGPRGNFSRPMMQAYPGQGNVFYRTGGMMQFQATSTPVQK